jgi:hypothetical protein
MQQKHKIIPKSYKRIEQEFQFQIPFFEKAFNLSYEFLENKIEQPPITALHIFKIFMPQLIETLNYLWKYTVDHD